MKLALIPPIAYLEDFSTDYHLVLAHLYRDNRVYRAFYKARKAVGEFIIMDNGAAELGASISQLELFELARDLKPNVLVCPDVLHKADATLAVANHFLDDYASDLSSLDIDLMAVPQGEDFSRWRKAYVWFNTDPAVSWLGISKYAPIERLQLLDEIRGSIRKRCHLLGLADNMDVIEKEKKFSFVESTDTAVPIKLGLQGLTLERYNERNKMKDDDYFNFPRGLDVKLHNQVLANIERYRERCL